MIIWSSYLHNGISYAGKMTLYYIESGPKFMEYNVISKHITVDPLM